MRCRDGFSNQIFSADCEFAEKNVPVGVSDDVLSGRVLFFNEINGTGYIEQDLFAEKLKFTYKNIIKDGYRSLYEGQRIVYGVKKVGTGTKVTFIKSTDLE